ncbi:MAG TPA: hypothetical protein DIT05_19600 [Morganella sp. (in: Bacteria)]|nr:hypothetical protein [Morganella sp. (in: enterobacteria)]
MLFNLYICKDKKHVSGYFRLLIKQKARYTGDNGQRNEKRPRHEWRGRAYMDVFTASFHFARYQPPRA